MLQEYKVEKKINSKILFLIILVVSLTTFFSVYLVYDHIDRKRFSTFYNYVSASDYDNASFVFRTMYEKKPFDYNVLLAGIDLYYKILIDGIDDQFVPISAEHVIVYSKQILLSSFRAERDYRIYRRLAHAYQAMGSSYYDEAYKAYKKAIVHKDDRIETKIALASICYDIGYYGEAIVYYNMAKKESSLINSAYTFSKNDNYNLALCYYANNNSLESIEILMSLFSDKSSSADILYKSSKSLADVYKDNGLYNESIFYYTEALKIDNSINAAEMYYNIGVLYSRIGRSVDANKMFRESLKVDNSYAPARRILYGRN